MVVTRFPPSPTGDLHIGSVRTALYSWLYARRHQGKMILRIEDTDAERSTPEAVQVILEGLQWLELDWDAGPYYQTQCFDRYREVVQHLLQRGAAYRCVCTKERLAELREAQSARKEKPKYDGCCREQGYGAEIGESFVVRLKTPLEGAIGWEDQVKGYIEFQNTELDDLIIARSDGTPTYQLGVVVDDWDMGVTHVIRGDDHVNNTPRQIHILNALGATLPLYGHIPMILGGDGKRLSKRHGAVSVLHYKEEGYLPEALLNYLVRLGWSHGDQEIFSRADMIQHFDLEHIQRAPATFNLEKLQWMNQQYLKSLALEKIVAYWQPYLAAQGISNVPLERLTAIAHVVRERAKTLREMCSLSGYFFSEGVQYDEKAVQKTFVPAVLPILQALRQALEKVQDWQTEALQAAIQGVCEGLGVGFGKVAQPLRLAVTGEAASPPMAETLALLDKGIVLKRLGAAIDRVGGL